MWAHTGTVPLMSNPVAHTSRLSLWWVININWCCFTWSHRPLISNCLYPINMAGSLYLCKDNNFLIHELQSITHCSVLIPLLPGVWWEHWCWESSIQAPKHWLLRGRRQRLWLLTPLWPTPHLTSDQSPWDKKKTKKQRQRQEFITQNKTSQTDSRNQAAYWILYTHKNCTDRMTSPMIALTPYSVLHTDTAWANTDDNCSKCWSIWITFTPAPVTV